MKPVIIFCLLVALAGCSTVKDVKKGAIPPSCPLLSTPRLLAVFRHF
ncbi:hypothetical protein LEC72_28720 [Salmonella enterica]|nr:hypothetical protein [Salmonella enterica]